ncbi:TonB-dependent receptor plug domain-containing protein [Sphingobium sp. 3R8]|uniref:TonB-dependent receptor n=1 Tax=Sphingobium sp. 3R8 TaxID=2874921 RepID=UPI001CCE5939|nr:TonB-dependent receptor [Sphingobium sp. 3R8]MBZ9647576.1 TonB-dependent receptor plug domain-containing protein [Sphingobium sp. 3R8]
MINTSWLLSAAIIAMAVPGTALAAPASDDQSAKADGAIASESTEIIVTAEKRSTTVLRTNIALSALSGDDLQQHEIRSVKELQNFVPGLSVADTGLVSQLNIRGIGLGITDPGVYSGVAIYRDNLFQAPIVANEPFYDIGSVQVLRGPQGTFVGNNSTGGALFVKTADPKLEDASGYAILTGGTYDNIAFEGAVNIPVSDTFAVRIATYDQHRASFFKNGNPPNSQSSAYSTPGELNIVAGRISLLWRPSDNFQSLTKMEYYNNNTGGFTGKPNPGSFFATLASPDPYTLNFADVPRYEESTFRVSNETTLTLANGIALRNMIGLTKAKFHQISDAVGVSFPGVTLNVAAVEPVFSEEFTIISPENRPFKWTIGGYYLRDKSKVPFIGQNYFANQLIVVDASRTKKEAKAVYGGIKYNISDALEIEGSARYTWSNVDNDSRNIISFFDLTTNDFLFSAPSSGSQSDKGLTWKIGVNYTADSRNFLYAFVAKGRKGGGVQSPVSNFAPESVMDYEAGWKGSMFGGALRAQIGGFYSKYTNMQIQNIQTQTGLATIFNAGSAETYGTEAELGLRLGNFEMTVAGSYLKSKITVNDIVNRPALPDGGQGSLGPQCAQGQTSACFDYGPFVGTATGPLPFAPKFNIAIGLSYNIELGDDKRLTPHVEYTHTASQRTSFFNDATSILPGRDLINAKLTFSTDRFDFEAFATNLTKEVYPGGSNGGLWYYGAPRQFGGRVSVRF